MHVLVLMRVWMLLSGLGVGACAGDGLEVCVLNDALLQRITTYIATK